MMVAISYFRFISLNSSYRKQNLRPGTIYTLILPLFLLQRLQLIVVATAYFRFISLLKDLVATKIIIQNFRIESFW